MAKNNGKAPSGLDYWLPNRGGCFIGVRLEANKEAAQAVGADKN